MPSGPDDCHDLRDLRIDLLREAVTLYLQLAYPSGELPAMIVRRLEWPTGVDGETLLANPPFERAGRPGGNSASIYALRLGNAAYPHMKLQIQPWPNVARFLLSVNTHDQVFSIAPDAPDMPAFRQLQTENQRIKEAIEYDWDQAGLPTFLRYLREYIEGCGGNPEAPG